MSDELDEKDSQQEQKGPAMPIGMPMWPAQPIPAQPVPPTPAAMPVPPTAPAAPVQPAASPMPTLPTPQKSAIAGLQEKAANVQNPFARALARTGAGILGGVEAVGESAFPGVAAMVPHSILNTRMENNRADKRATEQAAMEQGERKTAAEEETAGAKKSEADTAAAKEKREEANPKTRLTPEEGTLHDLMTGNGGQPRVNPQTGQPYSYLEAYQAINQAKQDTKPDKVTKPTFQEQSYDEWHKTHPNGTRMEFEKETKEAERTPRQPTEREEWMKDHPGASLEEYWAAKKGPTADEQRRADLAENLNENLDTLDEIVKRRPELFGPLSGRWAELKQKFGSDDPDLGTLQTIEHQIGMAQISAHGMRSAQGIAGAADSILNNLHSGPKAILASTSAARNSVKTFSGDVEKTRPSGEKPGAAKPAGDKGGSHSFTFNGTQYNNVPDELYKKYKGKPGFKE